VKRKYKAMKEPLRIVNKMVVPQNDKKNSDTPANIDVGISFSFWPDRTANPQIMSHHAPEFHSVFPAVNLGAMVSGRKQEGRRQCQMRVAYS